MKREFRIWLNNKNKKKDKIVGFVRMPQMCPIASYLIEKGIERVSVYPDILVYLDKDTKLFEERRLPEWAKDFTYEIDNLVVERGLTFDGRIKADQALKVLDGIMG